MSFRYELEILIDSKEELPEMDSEGEWSLEDTWLYKNLYYGFKVKDTGCHNSEFDSRIFTMAGTSTLKKLQTSFADLTQEVLKSEMPPKYFKGGIGLLNDMLSKLDEKDFDDNLEWEVSRHYPAFGIRLYLYKEPAPVKKPEPDGSVTGYLWNVCLPIKGKDGKIHCYQDSVFCIKPESAVHEALDRFFREYPGTWTQNAIADTPIEVSKSDKNIRKFQFMIMP